MTTPIDLPPMVAHPDPHAFNWSKAELRAIKAYATAAILADRKAMAAAQPVQPAAKKLWLWKNFVDGNPEYWAFDNAFPVHLDHGDPQTLGEPCGYALFKPSRCGRTDVNEEQVLKRISDSSQPVQPAASAAGPKELWLQLHGDCSADELLEPVDYTSGEVTWCWHAINNSDVRYVREDLAQQSNISTKEAT